VEAPAGSPSQTDASLIQAGRALEATEMATRGDSDPAARVEAELREQGLTRTVTDPGVLRKVAGLLGAEDARARQRRLARMQRELADVELRFRLDEELP
jgi:hypothetical protein